MARVRSPAQSRQFSWLSWYRPAGLSIGPRRSRLIPRDASDLPHRSDTNGIEAAHPPDTTSGAKQNPPSSSAGKTNFPSRAPFPAMKSPARQRTAPFPHSGHCCANTLPGNGKMVRPKPIACRNGIHGHARLQAFCNNLRLHLDRPALLAIGPHLHISVPEKLHRSRHHETPARYPTDAEPQVNQSCRRWGPRKLMKLLLLGQ